jgi:hypothetical protein
VPSPPETSPENSSKRFVGGALPLGRTIAARLEMTHWRFFASQKAPG